MEGIAAALILFASRIGDICTNPIEGEPGAPPLCRAESDFRLATPYYSIDIEAGLYVSVSGGGMAIVIQDSPWEEQRQLQMRVHSILGGPWDSDHYSQSRCVDFPFKGVRGVRCEYSPDGDVQREYVFDRGTPSSLGPLKTSVEFSIGSGGAPLLPQFERMMESLEIMETEQRRG